MRYLLAIVLCFCVSSVAFGQFKPGPKKDGKAKVEKKQIHKHHGPAVTKDVITKRSCGKKEVKKEVTKKKCYGKKYKSVKKEVIKEKGKKCHGKKYKSVKKEVTKEKGKKCHKLHRGHHRHHSK